MEIRIPGRVWSDAFDPATCGMESDLNLPQPRMQRKGRGVTYVYEDVTEEQANEVADYLSERALVQSAQSGLDPNERELFRIMARTSKRIREALGGWAPERV